MIDIKVEHVSKRYKMKSRDGHNGRSFLLVPHRWSSFALKDVSFDVKRGEAFGIIGSNGSGKSTLLKLLSRITAPSDGTITLAGRVCSLIELGAGFDPELTGRENVFLNGAILGMTYGEVSRNITSIVEFAELKEFIDVPVKKYSSGMFVRLGFSIAVHLDADIMLFDEVLAVGDVAFQTRCFEEVTKLREAGKTIVLVSHDLAAIERICDRALLLRAGEVAMIGEPHATVENYQTLAYSELARPTPSDNQSNRVTCKTLTFSGLGRGPIRTGGPLCCCLGYEARESLTEVLATVSFNWPSGYLCTQLISSKGLQLKAGVGEIRFDCPMLTMQRGLYSVDVVIERRGEILDHQPRCSLLRVGPGKIVAGDFYLEHSCLVRQLSSEP